MRFSLATMLAITAYAALACMALAAPAYHWTSLIWNVSLIVLAVAVVGAAATSGRDRVYWIGFAACGWAHYFFTLGPLTGGRFNAYVFSRSALDFLCVAMNHKRAVHLYGYDRVLTPEPTLNFFIYNPTERTYVYFMLSGFCVFSVICGVLGGWIACYLFAPVAGHGESPRREANAPSDEAPPV